MSRRVLALLCALMLLTAACGGGEEEAPAEEAAAAEEAEPTEEEPAEEEPAEEEPAEEAEPTEAEPTEEEVAELPPLDGGPVLANAALAPWSGSVAQVLQEAYGMPAEVPLPESGSLQSVSAELANRLEFVIAGEEQDEYAQQTVSAEFLTTQEQDAVFAYYDEALTALGFARDGEIEIDNDDRVGLNVDYRLTDPPLRGLTDIDVSYRTQKEGGESYVRIASSVAADRGGEPQFSALVPWLATFPIRDDMTIQALRASIFSNDGETASFDIDMRWDAPGPLYDDIVSFYRTNLASSELALTGEEDVTDSPWLITRLDFTYQDFRYGQMSFHAGPDAPEEDVSVIASYGD